MIVRETVDLIRSVHGGIRKNEHGKKNSRSGERVGGILVGKVERETGRREGSINCPRVTGFYEMLIAMCLVV